MYKCLRGLKGLNFKTINADYFPSAVTILCCSFSLKTMHLGPIFLFKNVITHCHLVLMAQIVRNLKLLFWLQELKIYIFQVWPYPENLEIPVSTDRGSCRCTVAWKIKAAYS